MEQLELNNEELKQIGFTYNKSLRRFTIPCRNGFIYYNPKQKTYKWYLRIIVGEGKCDMLLHFEVLPELYTFFQVIGVEFEILIK